MRGLGFMGNIRKLYKSNRQCPVTYEIRVKGILDRKWSDWFGNFSIRPQSEGETVLTGQIMDQAALHGVISRIMSLNLELISVVRIETKGDVREN
jgi:hypothetical protein